jgi:hypothetical protein
MWARFSDYVSAVIAYWQFWVAVAFWGERAVERFFPTTWRWAEPIFTPDRRRRFFVWIAFIAFVYANFQAYDHERTQRNQMVATAPHPILSPSQERLLSLIDKYQRQYSTRKLIITRSNGSLHFDEDLNKGKDISLIQDLYGSINSVNQQQFEELMDSMPPEYVRFLPEMRLDSPFVVAITDAGLAYLREGHINP